MEKLSITGAIWFNGHSTTKSINLISCNSFNTFIFFIKKILFLMINENSDYKSIDVNFLKTSKINWTV
jgi:hypothetical protein